MVLIALWLYGWIGIEQDRSSGVDSGDNGGAVAEFLCIVVYSVNVGDYASRVSSSGGPERPLCPRGA